MKHLVLLFLILIWSYRSTYPYLYLLPLYRRAGIAEIHLQAICRPEPGPEPGETALVKYRNTLRIGCVFSKTPSRYSEEAFMKETSYLLLQRVQI